MAEREMPTFMKRFMSSPVWKLLTGANIWVYRQTKGRIGGRMGGAPVVLLTTIGRKSGQRRTVPLLYLADGDRIILVASKGGWPEHPLWYKNLSAHPDVEIEIGGEKRSMVARTANAEERARYWPSLVTMYKDYAAYQSWTDREIPVVVLSPPGN